MLRDTAPCAVERGLLISDAQMDVNPPVTAWKAPWDALPTAEERGGESMAQPGGAFRRPEVVQVALQSDTKTPGLR